MLKRLSVACLGASIITLMLILGMSEIAKFFERPDSQLYMRVMDFIPGSGARQLPEKRMPAAQPARARVDPDITDVADSTTPLQFEDATQPIEVRVDLDAAPPE